MVYALVIETMYHAAILLWYMVMSTPIQTISV